MVWLKHYLKREDLLLTLSSSLGWTHIGHVAWLCQLKLRLGCDFAYFQLKTWEHNPTLYIIFEQNPPNEFSLHVQNSVYKSFLNLSSISFQERQENESSLKYCDLCAWCQTQVENASKRHISSNRQVINTVFKRRRLEKTKCFITSVQWVEDI